ncbi:ABC transporter permease subunit [Alicyclobacillus curvatus]|nr:ABC transporter permease subunit [Alicyclobacillus curvatus]
MFESEKKSPWKTVWQGVITVIVLVLLFAYPRTPPRTTIEKWSEGFPLHPFRWSTFFVNLSDLGHRIFTLTPGNTLAGQSISALLRANLWPSVSLLSVALGFAIVFGVPKGVYDGIRKPAPTVGSTTSGLIEWIVNSIPDFFLIFALELFGFFLLRSGIHVYFVGSKIFWSGTVVPAFILSLAPMMYLARAVKVSVSDELGQPYIQTAHSKGLSKSSVLWRHILPNCLPAIARNIGPMLGVLFSGLVIVEYLFDRKGIGSGLFFAMGHDGISPIYGTPLGTPPLAEGHPFDVNLCISLMIAAVLVFAVFWAVIRFILLLLGHKGSASSYGSKLDETPTGRRWSVQLVVGILMFCVLIVLALAKRHIGIPTPNYMDVIHFEGNSMSVPPFPPSARHWLGTDDSGRDLLSRCIYGIAPTLSYVFVTDLIAVGIGAILAILSASFNFRPIRFVVNTWNSVTSVIPGVILGLLILEIPAVYWAGVRLDPGHIIWGHIHQVIFVVVLAVIEGGRVAGQLQGTLDTEHSRSYMESAIVSGNSNWTRFLIYDLRPLRDSAIEQFIVTFTRMLLLMATLGFFEDVFQPDWLKVNFGTWQFSGTSLDWGSLFAQNARDFLTTPWVMFPPSLFVAWTAIAVNLIHMGVHRIVHAPRRSKVLLRGLVFRMVARVQD